jgi:hypothetical protein
MRIRHLGLLAAAHGIVRRADLAHTAAIVLVRALVTAVVVVAQLMADTCGCGDGDGSMPWNGARAFPESRRRALQGNGEPGRERQRPLALPALLGRSLHYRC